MTDHLDAELRDSLRRYVEAEQAALLGWIEAWLVKWIAAKVATGEIPAAAAPEAAS